MRRALPFLVLVLPLLVPIAPAGGQVAPAPVELAIDAAHSVGLTNPNLVGFALQPGVERLLPLAPRTLRFDAGLQDLVACPGPVLRPDRLAVVQRKLDAIEAMGAEPIVILDYMAPCLAAPSPGDPRDPTRLPPRDPAAWQAAIEQLVTALGPGRIAAGHHAVTRFEVWNEPDWVFWQATQAEFVQGILLPAGKAVATVAERSHLPLRFGVCGCLVADPTWMVPLLTAARAADIPVGFVSFHYYGNYPFVGPDGPEPGFPPQAAPAFLVIGQRNPVANPDAYRQQILLTRQWVAAAYGSVPEIVLDEWNLSAGGFDRRMDTNEGAAFQAAALATFADVGLERAALYASVDPNDRDAAGKPLPARYGGWGVIDRTGARKPAWYAQWLWQRLGPERLASAQDPLNGVYTAAARDPEGHRVDVLVASFVGTGGQDRSLALQVAGLGPGPWSARVWRVDAEHPGSEQPASVTTGPDVTLALPAQSVVLVELTPAAPVTAAPPSVAAAQARRPTSLPPTGRSAPLIAVLLALVAVAVRVVGRKGA